MVKKYCNADSTCFNDDVYSIVAFNQDPLTDYLSFRKRDSDRTQRTTLEPHKP